MREILGREINALAAETELHWNTVYKWSKDPGSVSQASRYALRAAAEKLGIELGEADAEA